MAFLKEGGETHFLVANIYRVDTKIRIKNIEWNSLKYLTLIYIFSIIISQPNKLISNIIENGL